MLNREKKSMPLCVIDLPKNETALRIFNLKYKMHVLLTVEPRRKTKDLSMFTMSSNQAYYKLLQAQSKMPQMHGSPSLYRMPGKKEDKPKCINCQSKHTTNYKGCSNNLTYASKLKNQNNTTTPIALSTENTKNN